MKLLKEKVNIQLLQRDHHIAILRIVLLVITNIKKMKTMKLIFKYLNHNPILIIKDPKKKNMIIIQI